MQEPSDEQQKKHPSPRSILRCIVAILGIGVLIYLITSHSRDPFGIDSQKYETAASGAAHTLWSDAYSKLVEKWNALVTDVKNQAIESAKNTITHSIDQIQIPGSTGGTPQ